VSALGTFVHRFLKSGKGAVINEPGVSVGMGGGAAEGGGGTLSLGKLLELVVAEGNDSLGWCCKVDVLCCG
jgi:hypothetical protein